MNPTKSLPALFATATLFASVSVRAADPAAVVDQNTADEAVAGKGIRNKPEKLEAFRDQALGMFIHWSVDSQLGAVISHSLVGADADYQQRFFNDLPRSFNPDRYDPAAWAGLAKLCGFRYAVFTTKHHSGFCMFPTQTTDFSIATTPYKKAITRMFADNSKWPNPVVVKITAVEPAQP